MTRKVFDSCFGQRSEMGAWLGQAVECMGTSFAELTLMMGSGVATSPVQHLQEGEYACLSTLKGYKVAVLAVDGFEQAELIEPKTRTG